MACRDVGWEVIYQGIRQSPDQIIAAAIEEDVHLVGLSVLSGAHLSLVPPIVKEVGVPVVLEEHLLQESKILLGYSWVAQPHGLDVHGCRDP